MLTKIVEMPFDIIGSSLYFICWYWTVGLPNTANRAGLEVRFEEPPFINVLNNHLL